MAIETKQELGEQDDMHLSNASAMVRLGDCGMHSTRVKEARLYHGILSQEPELKCLSMHACMDDILSPKSTRPFVSAHQAN